MQTLFKHEPVRVFYLAALAVWLIAAIVDHRSALDALAPFLPVVLGGETVRGGVVPVHKLVTDSATLPADEVDQREVRS